ncbi:MAG: hypothetical protein ETSY1_23905 [Candidatus Entotheonella factor]|uniref:Uncharacterized protein n=1 Tax=Entotheonella factor TaxID=1429438 RepID=W4LIG2_ENTF1|nr:hypothetical protein [Candidatus Entotheonella palauensis]ETW97126.1 MAG: hypothetical protein ETSY1_23905 [Candidatus Entotheonella factor]
MKWRAVRGLWFSVVMMSLVASPHVLADTVEGTFTFTKRAPRAALIYFPEDQSLPVDTPAVVDQKDEQFTQRIVVVRKGAQATFQNSDTVDHNTFVHDEDAGVKFDIGLMSPGGSVQQEITWENQIVRCGCKIHPKMRLWIASIASKYHKTVEFEKKAKTATFTIDDVPETLTQIRVWMPKYDPIEVNLMPGASSEVELLRKNKPRGVLKLTRK